MNYLESLNITLNQIKYYFFEKKTNNRFLVIKGKEKSGKSTFINIMLNVFDTKNYIITNNLSTNLYNYDLVIVDNNYDVYDSHILATLMENKIVKPLLNKKLEIVDNKSKYIFLTYDGLKLTENIPKISQNMETIEFKNQFNNQLLNREQIITDLRLLKD